MGMKIEEDSALGKEIAKWNAPKRAGGMRADGFEEFPKMLYRAQPNAQGAFMVFDMVGERSTDANRVEATRTFNTGNCLKVGNAQEERNAMSRGWRRSVPDAMDHALQVQSDLSTAAAEANYAARSMSEKARRELDAANAETSEHVADVKRGPGRPRREDA